VFKLGDVVRHKASRQRAVVVMVSEECTNPSHKSEGCGCRAAKMPGGTPCEQKPTGQYSLKTGFSKDGWAETSRADECELEPDPSPADTPIAVEARE
jgi:hypothetical protein